MATLDEVYQQVISNDDEKRAFTEAAKSPEGLAAFLANKGCDATIEETAAFLKAQQEKVGELSDTELDSVAGGCNGEEAMCSIMSAGIGCAIAGIASAVDGKLGEGPDGRLFCYYG